MQIRLLHAIICGIITAIVFGFSLIPMICKMISKEPTFGPAPNGMTIIGIIASVGIIAIILLSFKLMRRIEE